jgi:hypothetical protein
METLRNALGFFEEHGEIIVRKTKSGRQEAWMTLHPDWIPEYHVKYIILNVRTFARWFDIRSRQPLDPCRADLNIPS